VFVVLALHDKSGPWPWPRGSLSLTPSLGLTDGDPIKLGFLNKAKMDYNYI